MSKDDVIDWITRIGILPVIRAETKEEARSLINAIKAGGITAIEITMTVPDVVGLIAEMSADDDLVIGAGTVTEPEQARDCIEAGARFIVSPATNFDTIVYCNEAEIAVMPGALTPTEVLNAWDAGADIVKVFPASAMGGAGYLKALKAPLPHIKLIPTGGVNLENAGDYIRAGAEAVGVGGKLVDLDAIRSGRPESITATAKEYLEVVSAARSAL